jgi:transposase-like protein
MPALITGAVPRHETASANSFNTLMRSIGTSVSAAVVGVVLAQMTVTMGDHTLPSESGFRTALLIGCGVALVGALVTLTLPKPQAGPETVQPAQAEAAQPVAQATRAMETVHDELGPWEGAFRSYDGAATPDRAPRHRAPAGPSEGGALSVDERAELLWLRQENAELRRELDVLMQSVSVWVKNLADR